MITPRFLPTLLAGLLLANLAIPSAVRADDESETIKPVVMVTFAGLQRALDDMDFILKAGERSELGDQVRGLLENVNGLKGLDKDQPMGFALYLKPGLIPQPLPVGFLPVDKIEDLLETVQIGPVVTRKVVGADRQYEIVGPQRSVFIELRDGYALVANDLLTFEDNLESPKPIAEGLSKKYDLSLALFVENVPKTTRDFFGQLLRTSANAELQQRDDEPDARYALRKANGKRTFDMIDMMLTDVKRVVVGWDTSVENKQAVLDFDVELAPDTELAKLMKESIGKTSLFSPVVDDKSPLSLAASWVIDEPGRETMTELFNVARIELAKQLNRDADPVIDPISGKEQPIEDPLANRLIAPLIATAKAGHMDLFFQFQAEDTDHMVLVGGARVLDADDFGSALVPTLQRLIENVDAAELETSVDSHKGLAIHMLRGPGASDGDLRLYGERPALYIAAGQRAVWFAVGGSNAPDALKRVIDGVVDATIEEKTASAPPFRMVVNAKGWMKLQPNPNAPERLREISEKAFSPGGDAIRVEYRPTENGGRTRITIEEGFLRMMGMGIGEAVDAGERQRERFRERRENGDGPRPTRPEA